MLITKMDSNNSTESQFKHQLTIDSNLETKIVLLTKDEHYNLIEEPKVSSTLQSAKLNRQYYNRKRFVKI